MTLVLAGGLICEDDTVNRRALSAILERRGFGIVAAVDSAEELLNAAAVSNVSVILLELSLAGVAGLRIIPALRAAAPGCPIVLLSSFGGLRQAAIEAGAHDLIDPCDLRDLERCLDGLMVHGPGKPDPSRAAPGTSP